MVKNQRQFIGMESIIEIGKPAILWLCDGTRIKTSSILDYSESEATIKLYTKNSLYIMLKRD